MFKEMLKSATCAHPPRSRLRYCRLYTLYLFKGTLTKLPPIYIYFSAPVLNYKLVFANGKRLQLLVNQTINEIEIPAAHKNIV